VLGLKNFTKHFKACTAPTYIPTRDRWLGAIKDVFSLSVCLTHPFHPPAPYMGFGLCGVCHFFGSVILGWVVRGIGGLGSLEALEAWKPWRPGGLGGLEALEALEAWRGRGASVLGLKGVTVAFLSFPCTYIYTNTKSYTQKKDGEKS
jgi:hypothetical protein